MNPVPRERLEEEYKRLLGEESISLREVLTAVVESGDGIILADKDGKIRYVNAAYERMTGYAEKELIGKDPSIVSSGLYSKKFYADMWDTLLAGNIFQVEFINRRKNGELYYQSETVAPVKDATGHITGYVSNGRDVTIEHYQNKKLALVGKMSSVFLGQLRNPLRRIQAGAIHLRDFVEKKHGSDPLGLVQAAALRLRGLVKKEDTKDVFKDLDTVYTTSRQVEEMLDALQEFLSPSFAKDMSATIQDVVTRAIKMIEPTFAGRGVTFSVEFEESLPRPKINERLWQFVLAELLHHYGALALNQPGVAGVIRVAVRALDPNFVITIEGGKGIPVNSRGACDDICGCVWVDDMDLKFILMELVVADEKGVIHYEPDGEAFRTTLIIPQNALPTRP